MLVCSELAPLMVEKCSWVRLDSISWTARGFCGALNRKQKKNGCKSRDRYRYGTTNSGAMFMCIRILVSRTQPYSEKATSIIQAYYAFLKGVLLWTSSDTLKTIIIFNFARQHLTIYITRLIICLFWKWASNFSRGGKQNSAAEFRIQLQPW